MADQLIFDQSVEGVLKPLRSRLTPRCIERLRACGIDPTQKLRSHYPRLVYQEAVRILAEEVFPKDSLDVALFKLGETLIDGYNETIVGKAVLGVLKLMGPRQGMKRAPQSWRSGNNYLEVTPKEVSPTEYHLHFNEVGDYPAFIEGIMAAGQRVAGGKNVKVQRLSYDGHQATFRLTWEE